MLKKNFKKRSEALGDNSQPPKAGGSQLPPPLALGIGGIDPLAAFYPHSLPPLGFVSSMWNYFWGAFVYFAFPGCFHLWLFGAFPVKFWGQVLVSLDAAGQSFPRIKHCNFPNFFFFF